jgi:hypothetical protein
MIKIQTIKRSQMTNSEETRLSPKMLMIGQLKKRAPRTNINIQTSLLMRPAFDILPAPAAEEQDPQSPAWPMMGVIVSAYLNTIYGQIPYEKTGPWRGTASGEVHSISKTIFLQEA